MFLKENRALPIGISDFKEIIEDNYYYFDKTDLIEELFVEKAKVKLFTRPRRFGKTLNMSMLKYFFDINKSENKKLFEGLKISKSKYFDKQGTTPVIFISFKNIKSSTWKGIFKTIKFRISETYSEYKFLFDKLDKKESQKFQKIWLEENDADWKNSLLLLSKYLYEFYEKKVIILIDEYDSAILQANLNGYYKEAIEFFSEFYGNALKDNVNLEFGIMTGIFRVVKASIFSDLNNIKVQTILDKKFTEYFGILESEVKQALKDYDLEFELEDVQKWYNGYQFGNRLIYNPWSIINFLADKSLEPHWVGTSSNDLVNEYLKKGNPQILEDLIKLFKGEKVSKKINPYMSFRDLENNFEEEIWNLFLSSGYLTVDGDMDDYGEYALKIPNEEIRNFFENTFINIFSGNQNYYVKIAKALEENNIEKFDMELKNILENNMNFIDLYGRYKEQFYHGLMFGLVFILKNRYEITSNDTSGFGRYDLMLEPLENAKNEIGIIMEFKVANFDSKSKKKISESEIEKKLEKETEIAIKQIEEKNYGAKLKNAKINKILKIGVAFYGQNVKVK